MLHNYLIDIVVLMLDIIAPYNKTLYTIINKLNTITTTFSIYFAKNMFEFKVFENAKLCATNYDKNEKGR